MDKKQNKKCLFEFTVNKEETVKESHTETNDKGEIKNKPVHDWTSHSADAFRYFAVGNQQTTQWTTKLEYNELGII